ncbi:MAG: efflux RND transporter periplasmic adaptor subunit [Desulfobulbaceae bacterium]|nr:efflux RND transporter periplasmic adaptor subunit [Desulfobulbaceae bacterium]
MTKSALKKICSILFIILLVGSGIYQFGNRQQSHDHVEDAISPTNATASEQQYTCGMHPFIIQDGPGTCPICAMDLTPVKAGSTGSATKPSGERKIKYWVAPMDPSYIRETPGKSPMGMDLVPVYEDEAATGSVITIDPVTQQNMGVRTATVTRRDIHRTVSTVGIVGYEEPHQYSVNSKIDGWIERLYVNETGEFVKKNQPLLEIYSPELVAAQEEFLLALRNRDALKGSVLADISAGAERLLESSRKRLRYWDISKNQIEQLEKTGKSSKTLMLYAPYDGVITLKKAYQGMFVKTGMELFQLSDISSVWVYADIYENELPWVKVGGKAQIHVPYRSEPIHGVVSTVYPYVDPKTRTVKARIDLENQDFDLKPDMYVKVELNTESVKDILTVPVEAVLNSGDKQTAFVALGNGKFEPRLVKPGLQSEDGYIEIRQGLLENERVVTSSQFLFDSESTLREAIKKMMPNQKIENPVQKNNDALNSLFDESEDEDLDTLFE